MKTLQRLNMTHTSSLTGDRASQPSTPKLGRYEVLSLYNGTSEYRQVAHSVISHLDIESQRG